MYRIANAPIRTFPFPHICVEEIFPPSFYAEIQRHMIGDDGYRRLVDTGRVGKGYSPARLCLFPSDLPDGEIGDASTKFWRQLFETFGDPEFMQVWLQLFGSTIRAHFAEDLPQEAKADRVRIGSEIFLMRDLQNYSLGPHTDSPSKVVSVLFYLPPDDARPELGTSLYMPKDRSFVCLGGPHHEFDAFDHVATMPYRPNTLVAFPKTRRTFHGVEPLAEEHIRRDLMLYDLKIAKT